MFTLSAIAFLQLAQQRQRIVVVDEAHRLAGLQRIERLEDRGVAKALADAARIEGMDLLNERVEHGDHRL